MKETLVTLQSVLIATFKNQGLKELFLNGNARYVQRALRVRLAGMLAVIDAASSIDDLAIPGYRLHELQGGSKGTWSLTVSGNWRLTFRFVDGKAYDLDLVDSIERNKPMPMKNHPHPGGIVRRECLGPLNLNVTEAAKVLGVTRQALNNLVNEKAGISAEMAVRLSKAFGSSPDMWLRLQVNYDLSQLDQDKIRVDRYKEAS